MIKEISTFCFFFLFLVSFSQVSRQKESKVKKTLVLASEDTIRLDKSIENITDSLHSPQKAALYSAVFPGLGQIYNKRYIKTAAVWSLIGTGIGFIGYYNKQYRKLRNGYINKLNDPDFMYNGLNITAETLARNMDNRQRYRDYAVLLTALVYVLNVVDAIVDAHLKPLRKDPDLRLSFAPVIIPGNYFIKRSRMGVGLKLRF